MENIFVDINGMSCNCFDLLKKGGCYFIGASVTAQKEGWANKFIELATDRIGHSFITYKKTMGGVGLLFGLTDWPGIPDIPRNGLIFLEFSSGDYNPGLTPLEHLEDLLISLISKVLAYGSIPIIVHNWRADYRGSKSKAVKDIYDKVATCFNISVIRNDLMVEAAIKESPEIENVWFRDYCHTNPEGAKVYAQHTFDVISAISDQDSHGYSLTKAHKSHEKWLGYSTREIKPFFDIDNFISPAKYEIRKYMYPNSGQHFHYFDCESGAEFRSIIDGELMGVSLMAGPTSGGWIELLINGEVKRKIRCFDKHSYYLRFIMLPTFFNLSGDLLTIRLSKDEIDLSIAKKYNELFEEERRWQLVGLIGVNMKLLPTSSD